MAVLHGSASDGYEFITDQVIAIDEYNPQVAARILTPLTQWRQFDDARGELMRRFEGGFKPSHHFHPMYLRK